MPPSREGMPSQKGLLCQGAPHRIVANPALPLGYRWSNSGSAELRDRYSPESRTIVIVAFATLGASNPEGSYEAYLDPGPSIRGPETKVLLPSTLPKEGQRPPGRPKKKVQGAKAP